MAQGLREAALTYKRFADQNPQNPCTHKLGMLAPASGRWRLKYYERRRKVDPSMLMRRTTSDDLVSAEEVGRAIKAYQKADQHSQ